MFSYHSDIVYFMIIFSKFF